MNMLGLSSSVRIEHTSMYSMLLSILHFALYTIPLSVQALQSRSCMSYVSDATTAALTATDNWPAYNILAWTA
jgi:hypothetical protein